MYLGNIHTLRRGCARGCGAPFLLLLSWLVLDAWYVSLFPRHGTVGDEAKADGGGDAQGTGRDGVDESDRMALDPVRREGRGSPCRRARSATVVLAFSGDLANALDDEAEVLAHGPRGLQDSLEVFGLGVGGQLLVLALLLEHAAVSLLQGCGGSSDRGGGRDGVRHGHLDEAAAALLEIRDLNVGPLLVGVAVHVLGLHPAREVGSAAHAHGLVLDCIVAALRGAAQGAVEEVLTGADGLGTTRSRCALGCLQGREGVEGRASKHHCDLEGHGVVADSEILVTGDGLEHRVSPLLGEGCDALLGLHGCGREHGNIDVLLHGGQRVLPAAVEMQQGVEVAGRSRSRLLDGGDVLVLRPRCVELAEDVLHGGVAAVGCRLGVG
eukprot:m.212965 g.212965  ORF g.212965 m.212965 type:complete len:382 (-) comp10141_c6_seq57:3742-4887(-)